MRQELAAAFTAAVLPLPRLSVLRFAPRCVIIGPAYVMAVPRGGRLASDVATGFCGAVATLHADGMAEVCGPGATGWIVHHGRLSFAPTTQPVAMIEAMAVRRRPRLSLAAAARGLRSQ